MKEQLTINELKHYLGTGVKVRTPKRYLKYGEYAFLHMNGMTLNDGVGQYELIEGDGELTFPRLDEKGYLPVLNPLSMLTEPIKIEDYNDGKEFVPLEELQGYVDYDLYFNDGLCKNEDGSGKIWSLKELPFDIAILLFRWHFDVFGLINRGLAISSKEVNNKK